MTLCNNSASFHDAQTNLWGMVASPPYERGGESGKQGALFGNHCSTIRTILLVGYLLWVASSPFQYANNPYIFDHLDLFDGASKPLGIQECLHISRLLQMVGLAAFSKEVRGRIELPFRDLQSHTLTVMLPNQINLYSSVQSIL